MDALKFYTIDLGYVDYLKAAETAARGFTRVPDLKYSDKRKPKFLCGIVLVVEGVNYYVPVTSYKIQKSENFLIRSESGDVVSSLRFNYMFPIPTALLKYRDIAKEPDKLYRMLLAQELRYCRSNQEKIRLLARRTYKRVVGNVNPGLTHNSCDFKLLEQKCQEYIDKHLKQQ